MDALVCFWAFNDDEHSVQFGTSHPQPTRAVFHAALDEWLGLLLWILPGKTVVEHIEEEMDLEKSA